MVTAMSTVISFVENGQPRPNLSDDALLSVYYFIKEFIGASAGSSTVAIDNKIEQAMDLVKSHLMFAVREEVDVLKEKIGELLERISQLEYENGILRSNASQETLNKISQPACQMASQHPPGSTMGAPSHQQASLPGHPQHQNSST
ncbi:protein bunched, class 1/class 3/D/E isoforms-like [Limulus polyphemus]|uniref:Protein bunched, class 1/class 3/D/E isoforms-like n=1 Tax=Limulus polyphemus TaxID=6850 RepID=A0ABM1BG00_LIMPO|nr:protein bunched, class 1/class 3/D/E isoforms-like [Limulus polyphemus]